MKLNLTWTLEADRRCTTPFAFSNRFSVGEREYTLRVYAIDPHTWKDNMHINILLIPVDFRNPNQAKFKHSARIPKSSDRQDHFFASVRKIDGIVGADPGRVFESLAMLDALSSL